MTEDVCNDEAAVNICSLFLGLRLKTVSVQLINHVCWMKVIVTEFLSYSLLQCASKRLCFPLFNVEIHKTAVWHCAHVGKRFHFICKTVVVELRCLLAPLKSCRLRVARASGCVVTLN